MPSWARCRIASAIYGAPVYVAPGVAANKVLGIDASRAYVVLREGASVETSTDAYFSSERVAVRAVLRVGFGFPDPATVVKITKSAWVLGRCGVKVTSARSCTRGPGSQGARGHHSDL